MVLCSLGMPYHDPVGQPTTLGQGAEVVLDPAPWSSFCAAFEELDLPGCGSSRDEDDEDDDRPSSSATPPGGGKHRSAGPPSSCASGATSCASADDTSVSSCSSLDDDDDDYGDVVRVIVPPGIKCGSPIRVSAHDGTGRTLTAVVPPGVSPWSSFAVRFPPPGSSSSTRLREGERRRRRNRKQQRKRGEKASGGSTEASSGPLSGRAMSFLLGCGGCVEIGGEEAEQRNDLVEKRRQHVDDPVAEGAIRQFRDELRLDQEASMVDDEGEERRKWEGSSCWASSVPVRSATPALEMESPNCFTAGHMDSSSMSCVLPRSA